MNMHQPVESSLRNRVTRPWTADDGNRGRRRILIVLAVVIILAAIAWFAFGRSPEVAANGEDKAANIPVVTVIVPGKSEVADTVGVTGTIAALRDMPVGVQGEGGAIVSVLVDAGDVVRAGQVLARIDKSVQSQQVSQLEASLRQSRADAALAQAELDRALTLVDRGFISKADIDRRTATRDSANARVGVTAAQLREGQARLARLDIRAPDSGIVLERNVEEGQVVGAGSAPLFRIARNGEFELQAKVAEQDLVRMKEGMTATVLPVGQAGAGVKGTIWQLSPIVDLQNRQGIARIRLVDDGNLRPGGFAAAEIEVGTTTAPLLPESAVQSDVAGSFVYVINPENKVKRVAVQVGEVSNHGITIRRGLSGTEKVVMSAGAFLNVDDTVKPQLAKTKTAQKG